MTFDRKIYKTSKERPLPMWMACCVSLLMLCNLSGFWSHWFKAMVIKREVTRDYGMTQWWFQNYRSGKPYVLWIHRIKYTTWKHMTLLQSGIKATECSASECLCLKSYIQCWRLRTDNVLGGNSYAYRWS
jgi:hypothetical protein